MRERFSRGGGRTASLVRIALGCSALVAIAAACRKSAPEEIVYTGAAPKGAPTVAPPVPTGPVDKTFDKNTLLVAEADCALDRFRAFETKARVLRDAARAFAGDRSPTQLAAAKDAWVAAMATWQEAEVFRFGPAARSGEPGAKDLRDQIYPWPLVSRCKAEETIVDLSFKKPEFATSIVNGRGLSAYEYLLFHAASDNVCSQFSPINAQGSWAALGEAEIGKRKAEYASATADQIESRAAELVRAWDPASGNFHQQLASAGRGSAVYASDQAALNAISDALFYVEVEVKDLKLARPLGILACEDVTCPDAVESPYARVSATHMRANLRGFRRVFAGCKDDAGDGLGFDDLLRAVGAGDLADRMLAALTDAELAVDSLSPSFEDIVANDPARGRAVHAKLKKLTDLLKVEFVTVLNLEPPKGTEGDND